jgi:hypothetical protein
VTFKLVNLVFSPLNFLLGYAERQSGSYPKPRLGRPRRACLKDMRQTPIITSGGWGSSLLTTLSTRRRPGFKLGGALGIWPHPTVSLKPSRCRFSPTTTT